MNSKLNTRRIALAATLAVIISSVAVLTGCGSGDSKVTTTGIEGTDTDATDTTSGGGTTQDYDTAETNLQAAIADFNQALPTDTANSDLDAILADAKDLKDTVDDFEAAVRALPTGTADTEELLGAIKTSSESLGAIADATSSAQATQLSVPANNDANDLAAAAKKFDPGT